MGKKYSLKQYEKQLRGLMERIVCGEIPLGNLTHALTIEENHLLNDLVEYGYVYGKSGRLVQDINRYTITLESNHLTFDGWKFLHPPTNWDRILSIAAVIISLVALVCDR